MNTRTLVIALSVAAMATMNAMAGGLLSPHAADHQSKIVPGYNSDPNIAVTGLPPVPPRVVDSRSKTVPGKSDRETSSLYCARHMSGSPKMVGACTEHSCDSMPCCSGAMTTK
ncbi:MAG TPA: hypothetical protein VN761_06165 [Candidatus Polarisedimenticolia bacterium]|nr:hypothetical protein [Candidatus Polarisedimenticolia bacterium]